jgi:hypothetical protein
MIWSLWPPYLCTRSYSFRIGWLHGGFRFFWALPRRWFGARNIYWISRIRQGGPRGWGMEKWAKIRMKDRAGTEWEALSRCEHCSRGMNRIDHPQLVAARCQVPCICKQPDIHTCQQHDAVAYLASSVRNRNKVYGIPVETADMWITEEGVIPGKEYYERNR